MTNVATDTAGPVEAAPQLQVETKPVEDTLLADIEVMRPYLEPTPMALVIADLKQDHSGAPESARILAFLTALAVSMAISQKRIADSLDYFKAVKMNEQLKITEGNK